MRRVKRVTKMTGLPSVGTKGFLFRNNLEIVLIVVTCQFLS